jgi:hypothetical protein
MDELTSSQGSLALAATALLVVVGYRLARPGTGPEWLAVAAYVVALTVQLLGARGLLPGATFAAGPALRVGGALLLVAGLVLAGKRSRARRAAAAPAQPGGLQGGAAPVFAGLALVLVGQLARAPSLAGGVATAVAVLGCVAAMLARRRARGVAPA